MDNILSWIFIDETSTPEEISSILTPDEEAVASYKTVRDTATFTTKRLVVIDSQGITGRKKEIYSIPYSSILMWSTENAGKFDFDSEVELWTKAGHIKISLKKGVDVRKFDTLLAKVVL